MFLSIFRKDKLLFEKTERLMTPEEKKSWLELYEEKKSKAFAQHPKTPSLTHVPSRRPLFICVCPPRANARRLRRQ